MLMDFQGIFPMNKHETQSNFVRFGIYFNRKLCLKFDNFQNINIGHLKISRDYFWPPKFSEKKRIIYLLYFCVHFRKCSNLLRLSYF